jgi:hypothetical protein
MEMEHDELESFAIAVNAVNDPAPEEDLLSQWRSRAATLADAPAAESPTNSIGDELFGRLRLVADDLSRAAARKTRRLLPSLDREQPITIVNDALAQPASDSAAALDDVAEPSIEPAPPATSPGEWTAAVSALHDATQALTDQLPTQVASQVATHVVSAVSTQMSHATEQLASNVASQLAAELTGLRDTMLSEMSGLAELRQQLAVAALDNQAALRRATAMLTLIAAAEDVIASLPKRRSARTNQRLATFEEQLRAMAALVGLENVTIDGPPNAEASADVGQLVDGVIGDDETAAIC